MPSRRAYLAACGTAATTALAGCVGDVVHAPDAYCQLKGVSVKWEHDGSRWDDRVVMTIASERERHLDVRVAEEFAEALSDQTAVSVGDDLHRELDRTFLNVHYVLGFCGRAFDLPRDDSDTGCRNTDAASRADFNAVQAGDDARITLYDDAFRVHGVDARETDDWTVEYDEFDFSERHADHGAPLD
jgi:hypothetical protein